MAEAKGLVDVRLKKLYLKVATWGKNQCTNRFRIIRDARFSFMFMASKIRKYWREKKSPFLHIFLQFSTKTANRMSFKTDACKLRRNVYVIVPFNFIYNGSWWHRILDPHESSTRTQATSQSWLQFRTLLPAQRELIPNNLPEIRFLFPRPRERSTAIVNLPLTSHIANGRTNTGPKMIAQQLDEWACQGVQRSAVKTTGRMEHALFAWVRTSHLPISNRQENLSSKKQSYRRRFRSAQCLCSPGDEWLRTIYQQTKGLQ